MDNRKYIGMDVHQASISIAVSDAAGKVPMECIIETKAATVLIFRGLRGSLWVTFEEGTGAAWSGATSGEARPRLRCSQAAVAAPPLWHPSAQINENWMIPVPEIQLPKFAPEDD